MIGAAAGLAGSRAAVDSTRAHQTGALAVSTATARLAGCAARRTTSSGSVAAGRVVTTEAAVAHFVRAARLARSAARRAGSSSVGRETRERRLTLIGAPLTAGRSRRDAGDASHAIAARTGRGAERIGAAASVDRATATSLPDRPTRRSGGTGTGAGATRPTDAGSGAGLTGSGAHPRIAAAVDGLIDAATAAIANVAGTAGFARRTARGARTTAARVTGVSGIAGASVATSPAGGLAASAASDDDHQQTCQTAGVPTVVPSSALVLVTGCPDHGSALPVGVRIA